MRRQMSFTKYLMFVDVILVVGSATLASPAPQNPNSVLDSYGFEKIEGGKYALVVLSIGTWNQALSNCQSYISGATLFTVDNGEDSKWLGQRINLEKDRINGASKFWVGLRSESSNGPLIWTSGKAYHRYPDEVQVSGHDDSSKKYAWAVPDGLGNKLKYEFQTHNDEAEAYICQYI